jgi:hypothetical protein
MPAPDIYDTDKAPLYLLAALCEASRHDHDARILRAAGDYIQTARPKRKGAKPITDTTQPFHFVPYARRSTD